MDGRLTWPVNTRLLGSLIITDGEKLSTVTITSNLNWTVFPLQNRTIVYEVTLPHYTFLSSRPLT
jgi:hypothetical protein